MPGPPMAAIFGVLSGKCGASDLALARSWTPSKGEPRCNLGLMYIGPHPRLQWRELHVNPDFTAQALPVQCSPSGLDLPPCLRGAAAKEHTATCSSQLQESPRLWPHGKGQQQGSSRCPVVQHSVIPLCGKQGSSPLRPLEPALERDCLPAALLSIATWQVTIGCDNARFTGNWCGLARSRRMARTSTHQQRRNMARIPSQDG